MDTFASDTDRIAAELIKGGMDQESAMRAALRLSQSRQQANGSILGGIPTQPAMSDIPPVEEPILGGDPSRLFRREPTVKDRIKSLPQDVIGAGEALMSLGSAAALTPASMLYALRPGQKTQGAPFEFATRNMYLPRTESGIRHLEGLGEVLEQLPQTGPLPELQAFAGMTKGMGTQAAQKAREARAALAPAVAQGAEDLLRRQGLVMDLTVYHGSPYKFAPTKKNPLGEFNPEKIGAGEGAQAYGYGHYLSEAPRVAQSYADVLASPRNRVMDKQGVYIVPSPMGGGKYMLAVKSEVGQPIGLAEDATQLIYTDKEFPNLASAIKFARQKGLLSQDERQKLTAIGEDRKYIPVTKASDVSEPEYTQFIASNPGYFYTVDIPDEMIGRMLDWDKPLGQQSETIQRLAKQVGLAMDDFGGDLVARFNANRPEGAMLLREQGIPGIRYYDQASRPSDITSRKLVDLYNKYGDIDKAVDEMMRTVHNTPKEKQKIREQFVEKLQTGLTRNFVVFPGEEDLLNIIERNKDGGSIDRKKIEDAAKEIAKKYAKGGAAMMAGGGKVISIGAKAARTAKASKEAKIEKPVITEPAPSLATVDFADKNWRSAIDDLVSYMNNIGVPYAPWKFMRNEPDIPLNRVMNEIERDVSFVQSLPSFPKGQVDILQDLFKKARDAESSYSRSGTQRDPLTGEPLMSGGGGLAKTVQAGAKAAKTAAAEASKMRAQAGKKVGDIIAEIEPEKFSEALGKQNIEGTGIVKVTQADRTRVGGPSNNIGGSMFSALQLYDPFYKQAGATWGVGKKSTAQALINQSTPETLWTTLLGSEDQLKSNPIVFDQLFKAFNKGVKEGRLTPELRNKINTKLEPLFGEGADILDPKIRQLADTFEKRALLADLLLGKQIGGELRGGSIIPGTEILKRETEPLLLHPAHGGDVPTFSVGPRLFQLSGEVMNRPDLHPGFPVILGGKDLGVTYKPVPGDIAMRDFVQRMKKERGRVPGYYEWTMGEKGRGLPSQLVTDEYLTYLQKEGFKSGGLAKTASTAAKAAKKAKSAKYADPKTEYLEDWRWRPMEDVEKELQIVEVPDYIQQGYGEFMKEQLERAKAGEISPRDLIKAYTITQSSIGRGGLPYTTATKTGMKLPRTETEVRPEGAFAEWLGSRMGQKYLDAAERGELSTEAIEELRQFFAPFGKQNEQAEAMKYAANVIPPMKERISGAITGSPDEYRDFAESLRGVATAKSGFVGSMLGRGDLPTFDARQVNLHTAGMPSPTASPLSVLKRGKGQAGREAVDRLAARQRLLELGLDPNLEPFYQHLAHHAVWDKLGGTKTTHEDIVRAMRGYSHGGLSKTAKKAKDK